MLQLEINTPRKFLNPLLSKQSVTQKDFEDFKSALKEFLKLNQAEHENHQKNEISNFLHKVFDYKLNSKGRVDLCIFEDHKPTVIFEAKQIDNASEMISVSDINRKAFHEAILYFCQERSEQNDTLKHIVILTAFEWFVFDAKEFERLFWKDKRFQKIYIDWKNPSLLGDKTEDFYKKTKSYIKEMKSDLVNDEVISCAYFNLRDSKNTKENNLLSIYKLLSPDLLLKAFRPNSANTLNKKFYKELLYILGLEEVKEKNKNVIQKSKTPQSGTFFENISSKLAQYIKPNNFDTVIKLIIIWVNRILFLKLLESQIYRWNGNDQKYRFLSVDKITDFDKLETLFFDVLAKSALNRTHKEYSHIPYLNSSLFEIHPLEEELIKISNLENHLTIRYYQKTVLKDEQNKARSGQVDALHYLLDFLDAYDFSSEGNEEIVKESKTLINAAVLGLIFEKINGYKDGSFYTPSFITMYMAKNIVSDAVITKFNKTYGWDCKSLLELHNRIDDIHEANTLIDSIKICDPAVGSGHFLVSVLNEILRIKSELGILCDENGRKIRDYKLSVENDELIVHDDEGEVFEYVRESKEKTRIQKFLFHEKQKLIESCLFGVDINPNSVNICRLRLWVELLKNAYYKDDGSIETLPNIDINIKHGNSLISRFGLKDELKIQNIRQEIENYKKRVSDYKENLGTKKAILLSIDTLKEKFKLTLKAEWKVQKELKTKLKSYVGEYGHDGLNDDLLLMSIKNSYGQIKSLFGEKPDEKKRLRLLQDLDELEEKVQEMESGKIFEEAFEWRFEFPEVLDENGDFVGFDVIVGNPPYIPLNKIKEVDYSRFEYRVYDKTGDILALFFERALEIMAPDAVTSLIVSNSWLKTRYGEVLKKGLQESEVALEIINFEDTQIFDEATVESCIATFQKSDSYQEKTITMRRFDTKSATSKSLEKSIIKNMGGSDAESTLIQKIAMKGKPLIEWDVTIYRGILTGFNKAFIIDTEIKDELIAKDPKSAEVLKPLIRGRDIKKYSIRWIDLWVVAILPALKLDINSFPAIKEYLEAYGKRLDQSGEKGCRKKTSNKWYETQDNISYYRDFEKPKIVWGEISDEPKFSYDETGLYAEATSFIMTGPNLKYLLAILNSRLSKWYFARISTTTGMGTNRWKKFKLELFPVLECSDPEPFIWLVDEILALKKRDQNVDTNELEQKIDQMVYALYGLDEEDISIIEGKA